ncbi:hypothetical protein A3K73_06135 [Candidatus Pacearchaeota archaeon RBG_13_36_9]|nr:MAG: hypothetical protein A3K73_06135 [Candidatus Pacearchaeota archaeon RBG_13_36_9]
MVVFGRKKEVEEKEAPALPELPNLSDSADSGLDDKETGDYSYSVPELSKEIKELPSFPDSKFGDSLSQEAVKSAITPINKRRPMDFNEPLFTSQPRQKPVSLNFPASKPISRPSYNKTAQPVYKPSPPVKHAPPPMMENYSHNQEKEIKEPVYIRIDKFKFALDSFHSIKEKINEVEKYLHEIKDQKRKEDEELKEWENEIEAIKLRIEGIDNKIFSKV